MDHFYASQEFRSSQIAKLFYYWLSALEFAIPNGKFLSGIGIPCSVCLPPGHRDVGRGRSSGGEKGSKPYHAEVGEERCPRETQGPGARDGKEEMVSIQGGKGRRKAGNFANSYSDKIAFWAWAKSLILSIFSQRSCEWRTEVIGGGNQNVPFPPFLTVY